MKTTRSIRFAALATVVTLAALHATHSHAQFPGAGSLMGGSKSSPAAQGGGDPVALQDALVKDYIAADREVLRGQSRMADALGLKQRAAMLAATADALTSGATKDNLSDADKAISEGNAEMAARMKENPEMDAAAKEQYRKGLTDTAKAIRTYVGMKSKFERFQSALSSASPMVLPKLNAGSYIASSFPGNAKNLVSSLKMATEFAKSQRIDVPKDATAAI